MFFLNYSINKQILLIFIFLAIKTNGYLVFPIKTYYSDYFYQINNSNSFNSTDFLNLWAQNKLYTYIYVGTPPKKVFTFLEAEDYESFMDNSICPLQSIYSNESSTTFVKNSDFNIYYSSYSNMCFAKETFSGYTDFDLNEQKVKKMPNLTFLYSSKPKQDNLVSKHNSDNINVTGFSCFHMGLQITSSNFFDIFVNQLKKMDYIESTYWTIEYNSNNLFDLNEQGYLVIGLPPHKYKPNKFKENKFRSTVAQLRLKDYDLRVSAWGIVFDKIFFTNKNHTKNIQFRMIKCKFSFSFSLIEGSREYLDNIENEFFNELYNSGICFKDEITDEKYEQYFVIYCLKNKFTQIEKFPTLYFQSIELNYTFELTYKDLFAENGNKVFFLMTFKKRGYMFTFGKIFFKKYFLTYSFDNKLIGFYPNDKDNDKLNIRNGNYNETNIKYNIIIMIFFIFCLVILFILFITIKKRCLTDRQKRMNELIDGNYVYMENKLKKNNLMENQ